MTSNISHALLSRELVRFFQVARAADSTCYMFSPYVDAYWHSEEANDPDGFAALCEREVGSRIEHRESQGEGPISWIKEYEARFGPLSEVWFMDVRGVIDRTLIERYQAGHGVYACWDCHPLPSKNERPQPKKKDEKKAPPGQGA